MQKQKKILTYIIVILLIIGMISALRQLLLPIIVLGLIFLLYKFPPNRISYMIRQKAQPKSQSRKRKRAKAKFRVIDGTKSRTNAAQDEDDNLPKYH